MIVSEKDIHTTVYDSSHIVIYMTTVYVVHSHCLCSGCSGCSGCSDCSDCSDCVRHDLRMQCSNAGVSGNVAENTSGSISAARTQMQELMQCSAMTCGGIHMQHSNAGVSTNAQSLNRKS